MAQLHTGIGSRSSTVQDGLLGDLNIRCETDKSLAPLTGYGVGGSAAVLAHPSSAQQLSVLAARCHAQAVPVYVLGAGANLLVCDEGVDGVVVQLDDPIWRRMGTEGDIMTVAAGYDLMKLVMETAKAGLGGLQVLAGIPGTVGGAVRMNAGGIFGDIGSCVRHIQVMDTSGHVYSRDRDDLVFGYRKTNIVAPFILEVVFDLARDSPARIAHELKEVFLYKKNNQPLADRSAGCAFKNPPPGSVGRQESAGRLIERAGLRGYCLGGAEISTKHANFVVTHNGCTATHVLALIYHVQCTVAERFGVQLEREVVVWP